MQAVGRARKENSQCFLMVVEDSEEHKRDKRVKKFITAMNGALTNHLISVAKGNWARDIEDHQRKVYETKRKMRQKKAKSKDPPSNFVIVCGGCTAEITPAFKVVFIKETKHHLINDDDDDELDDKILRRETGKNTVDVMCAKCKVNRLGFEDSYQKGCYYRGSQVILAAERIQYVDITKKERRAYPRFGLKAWKNAPFEIKQDSYSVDLSELEVYHEE